MKHCCTNGGKQLLYHWLQQPLIDYQQIMLRQTAVAVLYRQSIRRDTIRTQGLQSFSSTNLHQIANTLSYYSSLVEPTAPTTTSQGEKGGGVDDNDDDNDRTTSHHPTLPVGTGKRKNNGPGWNTRKALMAMYQLYLISSQKLPILTEQLQLALSSSTSSSTQTDNEEEGEESSELLMELAHTLHQCVMELERSVHLIEAVIDLDRAPRELYRGTKKTKPKRQNKDD
jgi:hypothetical protein